MKLGILGTGMIVKDLMNTIETLNLEKVYLLATQNSKEKAEVLKEKYHLDKIYFNYDELLQSDVDTIYVALPNYLHYRFSKKALENHKNVICEKPFTSNSKELYDLINIANNNKLILLEAMTIHYMPAFLSLKNNIDKLGDIKIVNLNYSQYSSRYDEFKKGNILPAFDYHKSGGALYDINVYNVHFIVHLFGKPQSINYSANIERGIDTSGILTLDYGSFKVNTIGSKDCSAPLINTIQGNEGYISVNTPVSRMNTYTIKENNKDIETINLDENKHAMSYEFNTFIEIINNKDYTKANEMLEKSKIAMDILTKAREIGGIVFDADK